MRTDYLWRGSIAVFNAPAPLMPRRPVVLLVTADADLRAAAARALESAGHTVIIAAHAGHAVLACLRAERVDLLVAELSMEDLSGPALAARLRRFSPGMSALYLGNAGTVECEGVIVRPFTRDDLLAAVRTATVGATVSASGTARRPAAR
jgi:DNA-binding response OmpR family regulator